MRSCITYSLRQIQFQLSIQGKEDGHRSEIIAVQGPNEALPYYIHTYHTYKIIRANHVARMGKQKFFQVFGEHSRRK
jgi:hypothetical protein